MLVPPKKTWLNESCAPSALDHSYRHRSDRVSKANMTVATYQSASRVSTTLYKLQTRRDRVCVHRVRTTDPRLVLPMTY
jgi:hypothetical protein